MKKIILLAASLASSTILFAQTTWKSDKAHSSLKFTITHLAVSDVNGAFKDFDATVTAAKPDFSDAKFTLTAKVASVNTENEMRDGHLQKPEFFDASANPTLTFTSTSLKKVSGNKYKLTGNFTLRGVTKPETFDLVYRGTIVNPMSKAETAGFKITGTINRADFKMAPGYPSAVLSNDVTVEANGEFTKAK